MVVLAALLIGCAAGVSRHVVRAASVARSVRMSMSEEDPDQKFDMRTLSMREKVSTYARPPEDSELLSEAWKENDPDVNESDGLSLTGVLGGIGLLIGLLAFAQIPVGDQNVSIPANDPSKVPITNFVKILD